jgi:ABC-type nitrate/sulfonate/bicarbonate transport system permease component
MADVQSLIKFGESLLGVLGSSCLGMIVGGLLALVISTTFGMRNAIGQIFGFGIWFPFLFFWALPFTYINMFMPACLTTTLFVAYQFLTVQPRSSWLKLPVLSKVGYRTILQALLFYIVFDIWFPKGWLSLSLFNFYIACFAIATSFVFLALLSYTFQIRFSAMADQRAVTLLNELRSGGDYWYMLLIIASCFLVWAVVPEKVLDVFHIPTVNVVLRSFPLVFRDENLISQTILSLFEMIAGITLAGILGTFVLTRQRESISNGMLFGWLRFTAVIPILFTLLIVYWLGPDVSVWGTVLDVGFLAFYPYVEAYWGLRNCPRGCRVLLAANNALPYALIGMVFGEMISSSRGLVFYIVLNHNTFSFDRSLGIALWLFFIFMLISYVFRILADRRVGIALKSANKTAWP